MKRFLLMTVLYMLCVPFVCKAQPGGFSFGVEWGCDIQCISYINYNYIGEDGSNVSENNVNFNNPQVNGFAEARAGINVTEKFNVSVLAGIKGLGKNSILVPIDLKLSLLPKGIYENGMLLSCEVGISFGFPNFSPRNTSVILATGYHHPLEGGLSVDIFGGVRASSDHPRIYDNTADRYVPTKDIRKNDALFGSIVFGIAFNFK